MPVNPNFTNANATTPFYSSGGGGSGSNATFQTININEGGSINLGSSLNAGTYLTFDRDVSGTTGTSFGMGYYLATSGPSNLVVSLVDQAGNMDRFRLGDIAISGAGSAIYSATNTLQIGTAGTGVFGSRLVNPVNGSILAKLQDLNGTEQSLYNLSTINAGSDTANAIALMSSLKGTFPTCFS